MTPLLPPGALFSQHSLNTYLQCPRRFYLKYVERQPWPVPESEEPQRYQEHLERGRVFHQWIARHALGLEMSLIVAANSDPQLAAWWAAFQTFDLGALPGDLREPELPVVVPLGDYRLYARYDYLALDVGGDAVIVDWKTLDPRPLPATLNSRAQTRVYLYTLVAAGHVLTGGAPIAPERASMLYWFAAYPNESEHVLYDRARYQRDGDYLRALVTRIANQPPEAFERTQRQSLCAHCLYRTLCYRDEPTAEGELQAWLDEDLDYALDLEDVPELEY
jgi:CRISPR/Cas system-associated exonuclease Cas4 (RecB family)